MGIFACHGSFEWSSGFVCLAESFDRSNEEQLYTASEQNEVSPISDGNGDHRFASVRDRLLLSSDATNDTGALY